MDEEPRYEYDGWSITLDEHSLLRWGDPCDPSEDWTGIDRDACVEAFDEALYQQVRQAFPGADVTVSGDKLIVNHPYTPIWDRQWEDQAADVLSGIEDMSQHLMAHQTSDWLRVKPEGLSSQRYAK